MVWVMVVRACKLLGDRFESLTSVTLLNEKLDVTSHVIPKEIGLNMVECFSYAQMFSDRSGVKLN